MTICDEMKPDISIHAPREGGDNGTVSCALME